MAPKAIDSLEVRMARLEDWRKIVDARLVEIAADLKLIASDVHQIKNAIAGIRTCQDPGACVRLVDEMAKVETRLRFIEDQRNQIKGVFVAIGAFGTVIGAFFAAVFKKIMS